MKDEVTIIGRAALPWPDRKRVEVELFDSKKIEKTVRVKELSDDEFKRCLDLQGDSLMYRVVSESYHTLASDFLGDCIVSAVRLYDGRRIVFEEYNVDLINLVGHGEK